MLDQHAHGGHGVAPVDEAAARGGAREAVYGVTVIGDGTLDEGAGAAGAEAEVHGRIFSWRAVLSAPSTAR